MTKRAILALTIVAIVGAAVAVPARPSRAQAAADDCLTEPSGAPPQGRHWYYRTDRSAGRRCWYLGPQREKAKEAREVAPPKPRPSSGAIPEPKAEPPAEPIAPTAAAVPDLPVPLQSLPTWAAPIEPETAPASERGADAQLEVRSQRVEAEQVERPSMRPVPAAAHPAPDATSEIAFEHMLALVAAALALATVVVRQVFKLLAVRRIRRRRSAKRRQWEVAGVTCAPVSSAFADMMPAVRPADVDHDRVAAIRSTGSARRPASRRDPSRDIADYGIDDRGIEESLRRLRLLHELRRAAA